MFYILLSLLSYKFFNFFEVNWYEIDQLRRSLIWLKIKIRKERGERLIWNSMFFLPETILFSQQKKQNLHERERIHTQLDEGTLSLKSFSLLLSTAKTVFPTRAKTIYIEKTRLPKVCLFWNWRAFSLTVYCLYSSYLSKCPYLSMMYFVWQKKK